MTTSRTDELDKRRRAYAARSPIVDDLERYLGSLRAVSPVTYRPTYRYRDDPVGYARNVLGVEPWSRQCEILEAIRDNQRVAVVSGQKIGKSGVIGMSALWFYDSFPDARAVLTSTTSRQVDQILWRELSMLVQRSGRCVACKEEHGDMIKRGVSQFEADEQIPRPCPHSQLVEGELGSLARTGLRNGFNAISGFTAREAEAVAGISGRNLFFLADEASGITDLIFDAIEGNRAGGARLAMFSNGTRTSGYFFDAFYSKKEFFTTFQISSEENPNYVEGRTVIPGLATREYIEEKRREWGENSAQFIVRVKGGFPVGEDGKIFSLHAIEEAQKRWEETEAVGRLFIGVDPAGETGQGDESAFCVRRGKKAIELRTFRGLNSDLHLLEILRAISEHGREAERPVVVLDREGSIGAELYGRLRGYLETKNTFDLVGVRASERAIRDAELYERLRDVLAANLERWMRDGGAIPEDAKLERELHVLEWFTQANGRAKVTPKDKIRSEIGRSPDRYDALALAVWEPRWTKDTFNEPGPALKRKESREENDLYHLSEETIDPYSAGDVWRRG